MPHAKADKKDPGERMAAQARKEEKAQTSSLDPKRKKRARRVP